jgi:hypothetical protein
MLKHILIFILLFSGATFAQEEEVSNFEQIKIERLKRIRKEMSALESNIYLHKKRLKTEDDMVLKLKLESELLNFQRDFDEKRFQFIETATGQHLQPSKQTKLEKKDFLQDIQDLLDPAIKGIKKASERPRRIQKLNDDLVDIQNRLDAANAAEAKIKQLQEKGKNPELKRPLKKSLQATQEIVKELEIQKEDIQFKLLKLKQSKGSLVTEISNMIFSFFKTKGKNLLLAIISFILFFWLLKKGQASFIRLLMGRVTKAVENPARVQWVIRPIRVIYSVMTLIVSLVMGIMTLYALNDWVLVTFIIIVLGALIWSSKQYFPMFFEQSKIVLNLGAIREGERIIFQGLPWKIQSLGYYCRLVNPALSGGYLRINTRELLHHNSRPIHGNEPWFPTKLNDWVELSDGTFGKVTMQTPEQVAVKLIGDATKFIPTNEFVNLRPLNLSNNFGLEIILGVDYQHQEKMLNEVLPNLKDEIIQGLEAKFPHDKSHFMEYNVEFYQAGGSSLDVRFFIKCAGPVAAKKLILSRAIQTLFVEVCNKHGYVIPFNQLTVHMSQPE